MRALLVVNRQATTTSERSRDVLVGALRSVADVEVAHTRRRGHGSTLAREAAEAGVGLVVTLGGDGTVNEVVNGLMAVGSEASERPALAVVPGGSTNVFARALGLPPDWAEATGVILAALREARYRTINLGRADHRYFTFCAGLGLDAAVVRRVEQARWRGRSAGPGAYLRATVGQFFLNRERGHPSLTVEVPGDVVPRLATVVVQNTAPWTYLFDRPMDPNPEASFELGLDVLAVDALKVTSTAWTVGQMLLRRSPRGRHLHRWHDLPKLTVRAHRPQPFQLDGDYLGERREVEFVSVPQALRVLC